MYSDIFRKYDIRGIFNINLFVEDAYNIGRRFGDIYGKNIVVGYDGRQSSTLLAKSLINGLLCSGSDVICIGLVSSPILYFAVEFLDVSGGIMVTASHNPPEYNGFKLLSRVRRLLEYEIQNLRHHPIKNQAVQGNLQYVDVRDDYVNLIMNSVKDYDIKVAWDPGNGAMCNVLPHIIPKLLGEHIVINSKIDAKFPNHMPDPTVASNLVQLSQAVLRNGCDIGCAFDGDGDRIAVVDGDGRIILSDQLIMMFSLEVLKRHPGATIITDAKISAKVLDAINDAGGRSIMWKTGHSLILQKMQQTGAKFAGETSGHIFFAEHRFDDGLYAAVRLLNLMSNNSAIINNLPEIFITEEIRIPTQKKFHIVRQIAERLMDDGVSFNDIDGVRVEMQNGWWLMRASNTEEVITLRAEGETKDDLYKIKVDMMQYVNEYL